MSLIEKITNYDIIITPQSLKKEILKQLNDNKILHHYKFYSKEEIIKKCFYDYDLNAISYLNLNYNLKIENAILHLNNSYYIEEKDYQNEKLDYLVKIKKDLIRNNLLIFDPFFRLSVKNKKIVVIGYDYVDNLFSSALKKFEDNTAMTIINKEKLAFDEKTVTEYNYLEDEVNGVASKIAKLITSGVDINNIKLANINSEYFYAFFKVFNLYGIKLNINNSVTLYEVKMVKFFLNKFNDIKNINLALNEVSVNFDLADRVNNQIYNALIKIINSIVNIKTITNDNVYDFLVYLCKTTSLENVKYDKAVEIISLENNIINDEDHVFLLNFSLDSSPRIVKNEHYFDDSIASLVNYETSNEKNRINKNSLITNLSQIKNLYISYHLASYFETSRPSLLIDELKMKVLKDEDYVDLVTYSPLYDQIKLAKRIDDLITYQNHTVDLNLLYSTYKDNYRYSDFDNKFKPISQENLKTAFKGLLKLSYTNISTFFKCYFSFYVGNILRINEFEPSFYQFIGDIFHFVLSKLNEENFDFDLLFDSYINESKYQLSHKEKFLLIKLRKELKFTAEFIKEHLANTDFKVSETEKEFVVMYDDEIQIKAIIDKIMTYQDDDGSKYISLFDYKTGMVDVDFNHLSYGINIQLPLYYYFIKKTPLYKDYKLAGYYLQKILADEVTIDQKKSYNEIKKDRLKLQGYTTSNIKVLNAFDRTYIESQFIKSMKLNKDGSFYRFAKLKSDSEFEELYITVETLLDNGIKAIKNGEFTINPLQIKNELVSCKYCNFKDICFYTYGDIKKIIDKNDECEVGEDNG
jgi:ATP-dependent helicase/DNAse subunit B